ncbi:MAG: sulfite reductase subunit gamma [Leptothrix sp. (in: Bacteria)]|nr:sulfite reductase subunit gamma [Leptothrix sp. (in: b-proteobacteria)]
MSTVDDEGYLLDPDQWTEEWAAQQARLLNVSLDDDHWFVIRFMRDWYQEHQVTPDARHAMRHLEQRYQTKGRQRMFELFPYGYVAQACRIAGMKRPRAWSTG